MSRCNSQSCILAQEEEQYLHSEDQQLTRHVLLCLLLIIGLFAVNVFLILFGSHFFKCLTKVFSRHLGETWLRLPRGVRARASPNRELTFWEEEEWVIHITLLLKCFSNSFCFEYLLILCSEPRIWGKPVNSVMYIGILSPKLFLDWLQ